MPFYKPLLLIIWLYPVISFSQPKAGFTANGKAIKNGDTIRECNNSNIIYSSTAINANTVYWVFTKGSPPNSSNYYSVNVSYTSADVGKTVQTVTDINGKKDSLVAYVKVSNKDPNLHSSFTYTPDNGNSCASADYQFTNSSTGNSLSYKWGFGDGATSTAKNATHEFNSAIGSSGTQNFKVADTVTDFNGCSDISYQTVIVLKIPDASLTNEASNSTLNKNVFNGLETFQQCQKLNSYQFIFINNSTTASVNSKYTIDWGDNSGTKTLNNNWNTGDTVMHTYTLGLHVLIFSVTDANTGCVATKKYNVFLGTSPGGAFGPKNNQREFCYGDTGYFNISGFEDNPPGTIYQLHFDDGSADSIYQQPPPQIVKHIFQRSSCTNQYGYFTATCYISNPCLTTSISTPNFYVSGKPSAGMLINPGVVACLNSETYIYNTSDFGSISNSSGCSNNGIQVWEISPSSGYSIISGSLGSLNGSVSDFTNWKNGSSSLNLKFLTAGVYTIKLYITNEKCGLDSITQTICARANPQALFKITGTIKCTSDSLTLQNNSAAASCYGDVYKWIISSMDNEDCGSGAQPVFIKGDDTTKSPQVWFKEPGNYAIKLRTTALGTDNTCFAESSDTLTIKGKPKLSINSIPDICVGNSINPSALVTNCYSTVNPSYQWNFENGSPASSTKEIPGDVLYTVVGLQNIQLDVKNECGITTDSTKVNVIAKPIAMAGNDISFCSGSSVSIGVAPVAGYSYSWLPVKGLSNANSAQPSLSLIYNGNNADTTYKYVLTASLGANCFSTDTVLITVKKSPSLTINSLANGVCKGDSTLIIAKGALNYIWSPPTYLNTTTNDSVVTKPDTTITYKIVASLNNGCADSSTITINLNPDADAEFTQDFLSGCAPYNLDTVIHPSVYNDRDLTYNWYANNVLITSNTTGNPPSYILENAGDSVIIKMVAISRYGCKNDSMQQKFYSGIGVKAAFKKDINSGCEPLTVRFTNTSSDLNSTNFLWNFGNGESSNASQPDTIIFHTGVLHHDTTYYISLNAFNGCASQTIKDSVYVKALPVARFGLNNTFGCSPDTIIITNTSMGNPFKYFWDFDDGSFDTTNNTTTFKHVYSTGIPDTFTIRLIAENTCGSDSLPLDVVVSPNSIKARVNVFGSDLFGCVPHTVTFNNSTSGATTALWNFGDNTYQLINANQVSVQHEYTDTGTFNIAIGFTNGCSDTSVYQQVVVYPHPTATFTTDKSIYCFGDSVYLDITAATGNINRLFWGDNSLFYSPPQSSHYYNNLGSYKIRLYADRVSDYGTVCSDSAIVFVKIAERPITTTRKSNDIDCFTNSTNLTASGGASYLWLPDSSLNNNKIANPIAKPVTTTNYKVSITGNSGCVVQDSVLVIVDFNNGNNAYLIPGAFTPNGDGLNDYIRIKYPGYIEGNNMELVIYNRWGQVLFRATDPSQFWDGTARQNGNIVKQPAGTYIYTLHIKSICTANKDLFQKGTIVLIR